MTTAERRRTNRGRVGKASAGDAADSPQQGERPAPMEFVGLRVPDDLLSELVGSAKANGRTLSEEIRRAARLYLRGPAGL